MDHEDFDINRLRVASPCTVGWENMTGDERQRHCDLCELNVYNISGMTAREVERLITEREGRLCIRMFRRTDGTVMTKDCPIGLRAYRKRVARFAGAALTAVLGLFSVSFAQKEKKDEQQSAPNITRTLTNNTYCQISGVVLDPNGAVIPGAVVTITNAYGGKEIVVTTSDEGTFKASSLPVGTFRIKISQIGFEMLKVPDLDLNAREELSLKAVLQVGSGETVGVVMLVAQPVLETTNPALTMTTSSRPLTKLPH